MDNSPPPAVAAGPALEDPIRQYRTWATVLFVVLAIVGLLGLGGALAARPSMPETGPLVASIALSVVTLLAIAAALGGAAPWAVHAIKPLCVLLIVTGVLRGLVALTDGSLTIPLEAIGAALVLSRQPRPHLLPALGPADRRRTATALALLVVAFIIPFGVRWLTDGPPLGARPDDISLSVELDCARAGDGVTPIVARVGWAWTNRRLFLPPADAVHVEWYATTAGEAAPDAGLALLAHRASDDGIDMGGSSETDAILEPIRNAGVQSADFVIVSMEGRARDGSIELDLLPSDRSARSGGLELSFAYAHGDRWMQESGHGVCAW